MSRDYPLSKDGQSAIDSSRDDYVVDSRSPRIDRVSDDSSSPRTTTLPLDHAHAKIEWLTPPPEDDLARLLLKLIGEDALRETFDE